MIMDELFDKISDAISEGGPAGEALEGLCEGVAGFCDGLADSLYDLAEKVGDVEGEDEESLSEEDAAMADKIAGPIVNALDTLSDGINKAAMDLHVRTLENLAGDAA
jgi:hypothetical protein